MPYYSVHVQYDDPQWCVNVEFEEMPRSHHFSKAEAELAASKLAQLMGTHVVIHDFDKTVRAQTSFAFCVL